MRRTSRAEVMVVTVLIWLGTAGCQNPIGFDGDADAAVGRGTGGETGGKTDDATGGSFAPSAGGAGGSPSASAGGAGEGTGQGGAEGESPDGGDKTPEKDDGGSTRSAPVCTDGHRCKTDCTQPCLVAGGVGQLACTCTGGKLACGACAVPAAGPLPSVPACTGAADALVCPAGAIYCQTPASPGAEPMVCACETGKKTGVECP